MLFEGFYLAEAKKRKETSMAEKTTDAVETPVAPTAPATDNTPVYDQETGAFK